MTETAAKPPAKSAPRKSGGLIRSCAIFAGLTLVSRLMGLARDLVITARLGASQTIAADAYYTALTFPNLFRRIFAEGAFAAAFVPAYSRKLAGRRARPRPTASPPTPWRPWPPSPWRHAVVAQLAMPWLMYVINPGYVDDPAKFKLAVMLTQITMPYLPCMAIAALFVGRAERPGPVHRLGRLSDDPATS